MITRKDIYVDGQEFYISLAKLTGTSIKDVQGYITLDPGGTPTFKLCDILLETGVFIDCEGEHDFPYLSTYGSEPENMDEETMQRLYDEELEA